MADIITPNLLPGFSGNVVQKRLVNMGDGTFAELTVSALAASTNSIGTVNLGSLGGGATASNQAVGNAALASIAGAYAAATSSPLTATINDTAAHILGPFAPQLAREIWLTLNATIAATGIAQFTRSTDNGATKVGLTAGGTIIGAYPFANATGAIVNEIIAVETDAAAAYYLTITLSAGTVTCRVAQ